MSPRVLVGLVGAFALEPLMARAAMASDPDAPWTHEQAMRLLVRMMERRPFVPSAKERPTLGRFFHADDYGLLRGNPVLGYWDEGRFRWTGTRVAWDGVAPATPSARPITRRAWDAAFAYIARQHGLTIDPRAPVRIRGACLAAVVDPAPDSPNRGVLVEIRIDSPTGTFRYRLGLGKPTLEDAIAGSLDWIVSFARVQREPGADR